MIILNKLFEFDEDLVHKMGSGIKNIFKGRTEDSTVPKVKPLKPMNIDQSHKMGSGVNTKFANPTEIRRRNMMNLAGQEASHLAKGTANFVGNNQRLVGGAGLVGAGMMAHKLMNRNKQMG